MHSSDARHRRPDTAQAARAWCSATGRAWTEHQQGVQLDRMGSHVDAQRMHDTASEHAMRAGIDTVMLGLSAWGASSLYTGVARRAVAAAQRKAMIAEMRPYPSQRYTVRPATTPETAVGSPAPMRSTATEPPVVTPAATGEALVSKTAAPVLEGTTVREAPKTTAKGTINGKWFVDYNQSARSNGDPNVPTLIKDQIDLKAAKKPGKPFPNGNMATAHAEVGVIQQAFDSGVTKGADMQMTVWGSEVCSYCKRDIVDMAKEASLKSLTICEMETGKTLVWRRGMRRIEPLETDAHTP